MKMTRARVCLLVWFFATGIVWSQQRPAGVPQLIKFSGSLVNLAGKPLSGPVDVTFSIYTQESGGSALWFETQTVQADALGHYTALLGAMTSAGVPTELFTSGEARWLGVQVSDLPEQPRVLLVSVPYAMKAGDAQTLAGRPASDFQLISGISSGGDSAIAGTTAGRATPRQGTTTRTSSATSGTKRSTPLAASSGPTNFSGSTADQIVGVTQSGTGLAVSATAANNNAIVGTATNVSGAYSGVKGVTNSTAGAGVFGVETAAGGWAINGYASAATGFTVGIQGIADSTSGTALSGWERATTGATIGLIGAVSSTGGTGLVGRATATSGATKGIVAQVSSPSGVGITINNVAGGKLFSGQLNGVEKINVDATGNLTTNGNLTGQAITGGLGTFSSAVQSASYKDLSGNPIPYGFNGVKEFFSSGTFQVPVNVTHLKVLMWGAGGGGGSTTGCGVSEVDGGGGGGGAYTLTVLSVTPGTTYTVTVGAAGAYPGGTGGDSEILNPSATVLAFAGGGGGGGASLVPGTGGSADSGSMISHAGNNPSSPRSAGEPYNAFQSPNFGYGGQIGIGGSTACVGTSVQVSPAGPGYVQIAW